MPAKRCTDMRKAGSWVGLGNLDLNAIAPADLAGALGTFMETRGKAGGERAQARWRSDWRQWNLFAHRHGLSPFPLSVAALKAFKLECAVRGLRYETIGRYRQTLSDVHDMMEVPFIWSPIDVGNPLCAEIADGASVVTAPAAAPMPKRTRATRTSKSSTTDATTAARAEPPSMLPPAQSQCGITAAESVVFPPPANATVNPETPAPASAAPTTDGQGSPTVLERDSVGSAKTDDLAWSFDACRCLSMSLTEVLTSGAEQRATETMQLSRIQGYSECAIRDLRSVLPEEVMASPSPSAVPSTELASLLRSVRTRLHGFVCNGRPKTIGQVSAVTSVLTWLSEGDGDKLARILPRSEISSQLLSSRPASATGPHHAPANGPPNALHTEVANLREQLRQVVIEVEQLRRRKPRRTRSNRLKGHAVSPNSLH